MEWILLKEGDKMKVLKDPKIMLIISMVIFGTIGLFVKMIPLSSGEIALYRAILAALLIGVYLLITKQKIDVKSIGVGQYQHDVDQKKLSENLTGVVEDAVNSVGVDINTATPSLLSYVAWINKTIANNIVKYRDENGKLKERKELLKVPKLGKVAFQQCAGFIRIYDGKNPFEITSVHPESYEKAEELLKSIGYKKQDLLDKDLVKAGLLEAVA